MPLNDYYPAHASVAIPSDTANNFGQAFSVGGTGTVVLETEGGETPITFTAVPVGVIIRIRYVKIRAASTATNIMRYWS